MFRLDNKIAVVTGAGSGIGNAIANTFAGVGARVFVLEANLDAGNAAVERIRKAGGKADAIACESWERRISPAMVYKPPTAEDLGEEDEWGSAEWIRGSSVAMPSGEGPSRGKTTPGWATE